MPKNAIRKIELAVNILLAVSVVVILAIVVKRHLPRSQPASPTLQIGLGARIDIVNVDWAKNGKTLVFFLKKDCVYCNYSAQFFRQLIDDAAKRHINVLAVLPGPPEESREYLSSLGLSIQHIESASPLDYKVPGAPSILFVDERGIVRSVWIGADPSKQTEMRQELLALFQG
jgi:peroxiredoxin